MDKDKEYEGQRSARMPILYSVLLCYKSMDLPIDGLWPGQPDNWNALELEKGRRELNSITKHKLIGNSMKADSEVPFNLADVAGSLWLARLDNLPWVVFQELKTLFC